MFGKLENQRSKALDELMILEQFTEGSVQTQAEQSQIFNLQTQIQQLTKIEPSWRQESRCQWLKDGDRNTKYLQKVDNAHRRHNCINRLQFGKEIPKDNEEIEKEILSLYQQFYTKNEP